MKLFYFGFLWIAILCLSAEFAIAATYECKAVEKLATVYANSPVTTTEDKNEKTCTFSVGGATSSKAPPDIAEKLKNIIRENYKEPARFQNLFRQPSHALDLITTLMGATYPTGRLPYEAMKKLGDQESKKVLQRCFSIAAERAGNVSEESKRNQVKCGIVPDPNVQAGYTPGRLFYVEVESSTMRWTLRLPLPW
jgi:hypothetical protein